ERLSAADKAAGGGFVLNLEHIQSGGDIDILVQTAELERPVTLSGGGIYVDHIGSTPGTAPRVDGTYQTQYPHTPAGTSSLVTAAARDTTFGTRDQSMTLVLEKVISGNATAGIIAGGAISIERVI